MERLSSDVLFRLAIDLDLPSILRLCSSNKQINDKLCRRDAIWNYKLKTEFPIEVKENWLEGSPKERYTILYKLEKVREVFKMEKQSLRYIFETERIYQDNKGIVEIPKEIDVLKNLKTLSLNDNNIQYVPELPLSLKDLRMSDNNLTKIPKSIKNLPKLKNLELEVNNITKIEKLPESLEIMTLHSNNIEKIPDDLPNSLKYLYLTNNHIETIPETLPDALEDLEIGKNQITKFPKVLPPRLRVLDLSHNPIEEIPEDLELPKSFKELYLVETLIEDEDIDILSVKYPDIYIDVQD